MGTGVIVLDELDQARVAVAGSQRFDERDLAVDRHQLVFPGVNGLDRDLPPAVEVGNRIEWSASACRSVFGGKAAAPTPEH